MNNLTIQASLGDVEAKATLYKIFSENYQKEIECWTKKLYSKKDWMDIDDIRQDIFIESVDYHIENHKFYDLSLPDDYLIKKSIKQTIWQYVNKQTTENGVCLTEPHICEKKKSHGGNPIRFKAQSISLDLDPNNPKNITFFNHKSEGSLTLKETLPDANIKDPLDKLIYEEFVDIMFDKVKHYQLKYPYDLSKILVLLLDGEKSINICIK